MSDASFRYVYGPVPSRRLGRSLGVDLVPFKVCTYDCIYCQLGRTTDKTIARKEYVPVEQVLAELERRLATGRAPDYISLAGSGEPTLHSGIGDVVNRIKDLTGIPVAVLTNGSLLWMPEVQDALMTADLVLPSLDAGDEELFQRVNRPHAGIDFERMVEGIASFTRRFPGEVWLEIFLLAGITGIGAEVEKLAVLVSRIAPARVQLNTVARPPSEALALAVPREQMERFCALLPGRVEVIADFEKCELRMLSGREEAEAEILALLARRPCTVEGIALGLSLHAAEVVKLVDRMVESGSIAMVRSEGQIMYAIRRTPGGGGR